MAERKPLVLVDGEIQQLQAGDEINVPVSGANVTQLINNEVGSVVICSAVYINAANGFLKSRANAVGTSKTIGLVGQTSITASVSGDVAVSGIFSATTGEWDAVTGGSGGLTPNAIYYVSDATAGLLTTTPPSASGSYVVSVGIAISTTTMRIQIGSRILL